MEKRYQRNILISGFGEEGQRKLREAKVLVVGAGGLGSPVLLYLAAAGVGTLGIIDCDVVDETNLQRQILHRTGDVGRLKTASAHEKLYALNPGTGFNIYQEKLTDGNAGRLIGEYDFVVDCCDNYATKLLINDVCVSRRKPYSHGAVIAMRGEVMTYLPGTACYRCVFDDPPEDGGILPASSQVGILGAVAGIAGSIQAAETVKYLAGLGDLITNRLLIIDATSMNFFSLKVRANDRCLCAKEAID
jgi:molybdopterin/thiamine biosynthesis adenylyltransferase